jgi:hypothetical protein
LFRQRSSVRHAFVASGLVAEINGLAKQNGPVWSGRARSGKANSDNLPPGFCEGFTLTAHTRVVGNCGKRNEADSWSRVARAVLHSQCGLEIKHCSSITYQSNCTKLSAPERDDALEEQQRRNCRRKFQDVITDRDQTKADHDD